MMENATASIALHIHKLHRYLGCSGNKGTKSCDVDNKDT